MSTPHSHIEQMKELADYIADNNDFLSGAIVDDWGSFSNFSLIIGVKDEVWPRGTTNKIKGIVNRAVRDFGKNEMHVRDYFPPEPIRRYNNVSGKSELIGYHDNVWKFDIDYQDFDIGSNTFSG